MAMKYIVKVSISYAHDEFEFDNIAEACVFLNTFLDHAVENKDREVTLRRAEAATTEAEEE